MGPETRAIVATGLLFAVSLALLAAGAWLSRHTRRRDAPIDIDDDTAAELRAERRDEW